MIENPDPQSGTDNFYANDGPLGGNYVKCADTTQPGVAAIMSYLNSLPYAPFRSGNCAANTYYLVNNTPRGTKAPSLCAPSITDALSNAAISVKLYGNELGDGVNANQVLTDIASSSIPAVSIVGPESAKFWTSGLFDAVGVGKFRHAAGQRSIQ